jgi:serine/threonine-protein kinase
VAESSRPPSGLAEGDLLADAYRVIRKLGKGGMGEVWEAHHVALDKRVAIKALVLDGRRDDGTKAERLMREAKFVARIAHPNVVAINDFGQTEQGLPYFVMELLEGRPLHEIVRADGPLPWRRAAEVAIGIARGLAAAHAIGVIHRDLKPSNVFVLDAPASACKVIDFGIAKATAVEDRDRTLTRTGLVFGTPSYMSPEQARGEPLDGRADIYGLGCILHEALTGRRLFFARTPAEILYRQLFEAPLVPSAMLLEAEIPESIDAIVLRCLLKQPANRFQRMQDVVDALEAALRGEHVPAPPHEVLPRPSAALQARYGSVQGDATPIADDGADAMVSRPRPVLRAIAWIGGGAAIGVVLVLAAVLAHRVLTKRDVPAPTKSADDPAPRSYVDEMPRQPEKRDDPERRGRRARP